MSFSILFIIPKENRMQKNIFLEVKKLQKKHSDRVFKVAFTNYKGYSIQSEPIELAIIKSVLGLSLSSTKDFSQNVRAKYGTK